jgi:hypothetical protein
MLAVGRWLFVALEVQADFYESLKGVEVLPGASHRRLSALWRLLTWERRRGRELDDRKGCAEMSTNLRASLEAVQEL